MVNIIKQEIDMEDIFKYVLKNTNLNLKEICPILYDYGFMSNLNYHS